MKKYFVSSDVHSYYTIWMKSLADKGFDIENPNHYIIICGDLFDRGDETVKCYEFVKDMASQGRLVYVKGNHEDLFVDLYWDILRGHRIGSYHFSNSTVKSVSQLCGENEWVVYDPSMREKVLKTMEECIRFINKHCVDYYELGDYIFVHGYIPCFLEEGETYRTASNEDWEQARWLNGMEMWLNERNRIEGKTIVVGHWHCSFAWSHIEMKYKEFPSKNRDDFNESFKPWYGDGIMAIDACTAYSGLINVVTFEVNEENDVKLLDNSLTL